MKEEYVSSILQGVADGLATETDDTAQTILSIKGVYPTFVALPTPYAKFYAAAPGVVRTLQREVREQRFHNKVLKEQTASYKNELQKALDEVEAVQLDNVQLYTLLAQVRSFLTCPEQADSKGLLVSAINAIYSKES